MNLVSPIVPRVVVDQTDGLALTQAEVFLELGRGQTNGVHNRTSGYPEILSEEPWHGQAIKLLASGMAAKSVAEFFDCELNLVYRLIKTPWFAERLSAQMTAEIQPISDFFKDNALAAAITLVDLMQHSKSDAIKMNAADKILERHLGKATQFLEVKAETHNTNVVEETAALEKEVLAMQTRMGLTS